MPTDRKQELEEMMQMLGKDCFKEINHRFADPGAEGIRLAIIDSLAAFLGETPRKKTSLWWS